MNLKSNIQNHRPALGRRSGLTLVEMMVATGLLVVIMLGLTAMFNQTQRAFRIGLKQVDVFESGRAVMDLVSRDIEQLAASGTARHWSIDAGVFPRAGVYQSFVQTSPSGSDLRTNVLQLLFLLNHSSDWNAIGYEVLNPDNPDNFSNLTVGSLYRFSTNFTSFANLPVDQAYFRLFLDYYPPSYLINNGYMTRVADGVVQFRVQYFDASGNVITNSTSTSVGVSLENLPGERIIGFKSNALPAMVEVELGILEPQALAQARSVADPAAFLKSQAGKVHIFRQQIPIRNAPR